MGIREEFKKELCETDFTLRIKRNQIYLISCIRNNLENEDIQKIIDWKGERETTYFDDAGYCRLCERVFDKFLGENNYYGFLTRHRMYEFVSQMVQIIAESEKEQLTQIKEDKIKKLQEELKRLKEEIK